jgi:hypothetical protein
VYVQNFRKFITKNGAMRNFLLFCSLILFDIPGISQNLNTAIHYGVDQPGNIVSVNSKTYYWERHEVDCCQDYANIIARDHLGNIIWTKVMMSDENNFPQKLIVTNDKNLAIIYRALGCDVDNTQYYLLKCDTSGNTLFHILLPQAGYCDIASCADSSLYLVNGNTLFQYSKSGQLISQINTGMSNINSLTAMNNGHLLLNGSLGSGIKNAEFTTGGSIVNQQNASAIDLFVETSAGSLIGRNKTTKYLEKYSANLGHISTSTVSIAAFTLKNDSLFVAGNNIAPNNIFYGICDTSLNTIYYTSESFRGIYPTGISRNNLNKVNIVTKGFSSLGLMPFEGFYELQVNGTFASQSDIGVASFIINSASFKYNYGNMYYGIIDMGVKVKNYGADTIRSFYLNYYAQYFLCYILLHKQYTVMVPPGDSATVQTGAFYLQPFYSSGQAPNTKNFKVCLFTTIPNASNDIEINNDSKCDSVLFTFTGIGENYLDEVNLNLFPNPSESSFTVTSAYMIEKIKIVDLNGECVKEEEINAHESNINSMDLSPGIYFVHFFTEKGRLVKKLVKD